MKRSYFLLTMIAGIWAYSQKAEAPGESKPSRSRERVRMPSPAFQTEVPKRDFDIIQGRPTDHSVTFSILAYRDIIGSIAYRKRNVASEKELPSQLFPGGKPVEVKIEALDPDTQYLYQFKYQTTDAVKAGVTPENYFNSAKSTNNSFTFTVQADSHLDYGIDPRIYEKSLELVRTSESDFHIDLGDTFMTDKYREYRWAAPQYVAQRYYFGCLAGSVPIFLVLGNHDGETPADGRGGIDMAIWSNDMRRRYFPNPVPDGFYSGNQTPHPQAGVLQDYYAWHWGDACFIALDPFWYSQEIRGRNADPWGRTLGRQQYAWLQRTLKGDRSKYIFVFIHHLVGGETREGRGGAEASRYFEWGGLELNDTATFTSKRPGWTSPIHDLLVKYRVSAVFHGHDHFYAHQQRDGMIYQLVPQPDHVGFNPPNNVIDYGYRSGEIQGPSGILRIKVSSEHSVVEYVRAFADSAENENRRTGMVSDRYSILPRQE